MHSSQSSSAFGRQRVVASGIRTGVTSNRGRLSLDGSHSWENRVDAKVTALRPQEFMTRLLSSSSRTLADLNVLVVD
jgi:hypothetical protein